jgi:hypothetical protein
MQSPEGLEDAPFNLLIKGGRYWFSVQHCKPIPVMKTGFFLCSFSYREKPVFITWESCSGPVLALYGIAV